MLSRDVTGIAPVMSVYKVLVVTSPSAAQQKTLLALWLSSKAFDLLMIGGAMSANPSWLDTSPSNFIWGHVVRILARYFSDGLWKWLGTVLGIYALSFAGSNFGFLPTACCLLPRQLFRLMGRRTIDACTSVADVCTAVCGGC